MDFFLDDEDDEAFDDEDFDAEEQGDEEDEDPDEEDVEEEGTWQVAPVADARGTLSYR